MEIGEYLTNVLSITGFASIPFKYVKSSDRDGLHRLESTWRKDGFLVVINQDTSGLWLFGNAPNDIPDLLPSDATESRRQLVVDGVEIEVSNNGDFASTSVTKPNKPLSTPTNLQFSTAPSSLSNQDFISRTAQLATAKAVLGSLSPSNPSETTPTVMSSHVGDEFSDSTIAPRNIHELFIAAVLSSLTYKLCRTSEFVPLNARTLLISPSIPPRVHDTSGTLPKGQLRVENETVMVDLDVHLTSLGTLTVKSRSLRTGNFSCILNKERWQSSASMRGDVTALYLAPIGSAARLYMPEWLEMDDQASEQLQISEESYITRYPRFKHKFQKWKDRCSEWLKSKGISSETIENGQWIMVQIFVPSKSPKIELEAKDGLYTPDLKILTIPWLASLCYRFRSHHLTSDHITNLGRSYDPLRFAESWFAAKADRELNIANRKKEKEAAAVAIAAQAETERFLALNNNSPVNLRRASIAGAVYPTPPDGLPIGATPTFDGNVSTPGFLNHHPPQHGTETGTVPRPEPNDSANNLFDTSDVKKEPDPSSMAFTESGGDLFGDLGGDDLFGENDITDADFSFFDQPDVDEEAEEEKEDKMEAADVERDRLSPAKEESPLKLEAAEASHQVSGQDRLDEEMHDAHAQTVSEIKDTDQISFPVSTEETEKILIPIPDKLELLNPTLSPEIIFGRLSKSGSRNNADINMDKISRRYSLFDGLGFSESFSRFEDKYGPRGSFTLTSLKKKVMPLDSITLPKTPNFIKRRKTIAFAAQMHLTPGEVGFNPQMILLHANSQSREDSNETCSSSRSRSSSVSSDRKMTDDSAEGQVVDARTSKRKRAFDDSESGSKILSSFGDLSMENCQTATASQPTDLLDPTSLNPDPAAWSLVPFFSEPGPDSTTPPALSDLQMIAAAQILSDQAISRTFKLLKQEQGPFGIKSETQSLPTLIQEKLSRATKDLFGQATDCTVAAYLDIQGQHPAGQLNRLPPRPIPQPNAPNRPDMLRMRPTFSISPPHLQVRRADSKLSLLPSAIQFWESLGLEPSKGAKNISAVCVYPDGSGMTEGVGTFLEQISSAYESGKFGSHARVSHLDIPNGLLPIDFIGIANASVADHQAVLARINRAAIQLGGILASESKVATNLVVYYIYDPENANLLVSICSSFHDLFRAYQEKLVADKSTALNELVLQLVPLDMVASQSSLVILESSEYLRLAMEVYDRCMDFSSGTTSSSIILESPLPRNIDFKLTANPSSSIMYENTVIHIAYSQSLDDRWITAAWTDNIGSQQANASYCLGRKASRLAAPFSAIAHEIWETTLDMISFRNVQWRVMIVKSGVMDPSEIDFWKGLASTESKAQISLALITVDTSPSLTLLTTSVSTVHGSQAAPPLVYTTPVSTPSASVISPNHDQSANPQTPHSHAPANATTPGGTDGNELKIEPDATLIDVTDQTWGILLSHRLNNSRSLLEFNPTLFSGYLIKRNAATLSSLPVVLEVNLIHSEMNPRYYETLLREILTYYRGLATLARARGVTGPDDGRPWHIAAAEKGVAVLGRLM